jgi:hypothetical protein
MANIHDINGPSQLFRRQLCPGSAQQERAFYPDEIPETDNSSPESIHEAAARGNLMHSETTRMIAMLNQGAEIIAADVDAKLPDDDKATVIWAAEKVKELKEAFKQKGGQEIIEINEHSLDLSHLGIIRGGTVDYAAISMPRALLVDFKFGSGYVQPPKWNWQFKAYASGMARMFGVKEVTAVKLQPAKLEEDRVQEYTFVFAEIEKAEAEINDIVAETAVNGAQLVPGDQQCHWCRARDICPARRSVVASVPSHVSVPDYLKSITAEKRGDFFSRLHIAESWIRNAIEACTYFALAENMQFEGYEKGYGRKSREWADDPAVLAKLRSLAMDNGKDPESLEKHEIVSVAEAEKVFGKSKAMREKLAALINEVPGKEKLVKKKAY